MLVPKNITTNSLSVRIVNDYHKPTKCKDTLGLLEVNGIGCFSDYKNVLTHSKFGTNHHECFQSSLSFLYLNKIYKRDIHWMTMTCVWFEYQLLFLICLLVAPRILMIPPLILFLPISNSGTITNTISHITCIRGRPRILMIPSLIISFYLNL